MPRLVVASHNLRSNGLKRLSEALTEKIGYRVWRKKPEVVRPFQHAVTFLPGIDKREQFASFLREGVSSPAFATNLEDAKKLPTKQVVVRALTDASEGRGISIVDKEQLSINAPLYTEYIPKKKEYRVHVVDSKIVDIQEKRKKREYDEDRNTQVRNTANGYVFCRNDVVPPDDCATTALAAVQSLGRTYGAVDIIYNEKRNKCYVLEVNSRPGMEGATVAKYADAIIAGLPEDVKHPTVSARRHDGKKLITTKKGARVWRTM